MKSCYLLFLFSLLSIYAESQCSIEGIIVDSNLQVLAKAGVSLKNTHIGGAANAYGYFKIENIPCGDQLLEFSHIGYITKIIKISLKEDSMYSLKIVMVKQTVKLRGVEIQSERTNQLEMINIPVRTKVIDVDEISRSPAISTSKILNNVSGVNVSNEFGIFSSTTSVSLRGIGGNSQTGTLIVYDGIPLNKSDGGSVNWNLIDKDNIEKIEIIKGPGSALFGSNAMGGVINIISKTPDSKFGFKVSASSGTYATLELKTDLHGSFFKNLVYWKAFFSRRISDGYISTPDEIIKENDSIVVPVFLKELFAGGLLGFQINENNTIEVALNYFDDIRGRGIKIYEHLGSNIDRDTYQSFIKYKGKIRKWRIYSNIYGLNERYFRLNEYYNDGAYTLYEADSRREDYGLRIVTEVPIGKNNEMTFGGETRTGMVHGADIYYTSTDLIRNKGTMDIYALFIQNKYTFKNRKWSILSGIRFDGAVFHDASFEIKEPSYSIEYLTAFQFDNIEAQSWTALNPKLSLNFELNENFRMYLSLAKGFRAPILDDLCRSEHSQFGFRVANPAIKPEHIYNAEIGLDNRICKTVKTELSVYYSIGNDFMQLLSTNDSVNLGYTIAPIYKISNISKVNIWGLEADISSPICKFLSVSFNYSFNHSTISDFTPNSAADFNLTGKFLPNTPMHQFGLGIYFNCEYFNFSITGKYTGARWIKDDNSVDKVYLLTDKYKPYFVTDMRLWKKIKWLEFSIDLDNLFNVIFINSKGYKSPGLMTFGKISYTFGKKKTN